MSNHVIHLFEQARKLTADEREQLAAMLIESLEPEGDYDEAWTAEVNRRWDEHVASGADAIDALEAVEDARRRLRQSGNCGSG